MLEEKGIYTAEERRALDEFKKRMKDVHLDKMELLEERRLINWLRARNLKLDDSERMLRRSLEWRQKNKIDNILTINNIPMWHPLLYTIPIDLIGVDKNGNILIAVAVSNFEIKKCIQTYGKEISLSVIYFLLETAYAEVVARSTDPNRFGKSIFLVDADGLKFNEFMSTEVLEVMISALKIVEANYPEMLSKAFIINAPLIFSILWNTLKPFVSAQTQSKVTIIGQDADKIQSCLLESIDSDVLPRKWGGTGYSERIPSLNFSSGSLKDSAGGKGLTEAVISPGDTLEFSYDIQSPKVLLSWVFKLINYDIGFVVLYRPLDHGECTNDTKEMFEYKRIDSQKMHSSFIIIDTPGQYILRFDNSYSRFREKIVQYHVELTNETMNANSDSQLGQYHPLKYFYKPPM